MAGTVWQTWSQPQDGFAVENGGLWSALSIQSLVLATETADCDSH
jgi:hypothetical protein